VSRRLRSSERGAALIIVLFASALVLLLLATALTITRMSGRMTARQLTAQGQSFNASSAGLTNALSWFVHQRVQPVTVFNPTGTDTEDSTIGIVRTYQISDPGRVTGRYEVRKSAVTDVSTRRRRTPGTVWQIDSVGYVYVENSAGSGPGVNGNTVLAKKTMRAEIQRLALALPANAALSSVTGRNINISASGRVLGGTNGIGIAYAPSTGTPRVSGTVSGNPAQNTTNGSFALSSVFGVTQQELIGMADIVVDDERDLPDPMPTMSLIVIRGNATFNSTKRLTGSGILVVLGHLTLNPQSNAFFNGLVWVGGNLVMSPPSSLTGAVVVNGNVQMTGGSEIAEIDYDSSILDQIRLQKGNYLFSRSPWIVTKGN
jgi:Tfp pilus assembly protein PilX